MLEKNPLEKRIYIARLYDIYGSILTEKQRKVYEMHELDDLSLSEISVELSVSRQGISDQLQRARDRLLEMERSIGMAHEIDGLKGRLSLILDMLNQNIDRLPSDFFRKAVSLASDDFNDGEGEVTV